MPRGESSPRKYDAFVKLLHLAATRAVACGERLPDSTRPHHTIGSPDSLSYRSTLRFKFSRMIPGVPCHCLTFHRLSTARVDLVHARESARRRKHSRRSCLKQQAAPMRPQRPRTLWYRHTAKNPCYCGRLPGALWPECVIRHGLTIHCSRQSAAVRTTSAAVPTAARYSAA